MSAWLRRYIWSCGLLLLPIFAWNVVLTPRLPAPWGTAEFNRDLPFVLATSEAVFRLAVSVIPFFMPLDVATRQQRIGLVGFVVGVGLYFASWIVLIAAPDSAWAQGVLGFFAPAYTPAIWLVGIALVGRRLYWGRAYRWWMFLIPTAGFLGAHIAHVAVVYGRGV